MVGSVGRLAAGGGGDGTPARAGASGQASSGADALVVLFGVAGLPYKDAAEVTGGLLKDEKVGRLEARGEVALGTLGLGAFLNSLISTLPTGV